MASSFFEQPILNSPYEPPSLHHALGPDGQPLDQAPVAGRRRSELITPVPKAKKQTKARQGALALGNAGGFRTADQAYDPTPIVNEIRGHVATWRNLLNPADWGVTPTTARLLQHWRGHDFSGVRPFFCQVEAVETLIWLTEVAARGRELGVFVRSRSELPRARAAAEAAGFETLELTARGVGPAGRVSVGTMHLAKGLEFKAVAVMACDDGVSPLQARVDAVVDEADLDDVFDTERQLFYVACTRARDRLLVTGVAPGSEFLGDLE